LVLGLLIFASPIWCQNTLFQNEARQGAPQQDPPKPPSQDFEEPPEEDPALIPKEYTFNPIEAGKNITAGNYYFKKGNHRAASRRYLEATKWDPTSADAWYRLADASERMRDFAQAREAYNKYLGVAPDAKNASAIRKRLTKLPAAKSATK
jgi:tetratricopeptide (TPR) repeat protein